MCIDKKNPLISNFHTKYLVFNKSDIIQQNANYPYSRIKNIRVTLYHTEILTKVFLSFLRTSYSNPVIFRIKMSHF